MMTALGKIDQFIKEIDAADSIDAVTIALRKHLNFMGFERFSYQLLRSADGIRPRFYISAYPEEWVKRYNEKQYVSDDLVSRHAARAIRPFSWLEIGRLSSFTDSQKIVFNEATEFDIKTGGTVPIHGPGQAKGLFTVASDLSETEFAKLFQQCRHEIHLVATYLHERLMALGVPRIAPISPKLTPREIEIMTWTARGKTRWEISEVLNVSEDTVKTHIENFCHKLDASNKTHAVAVALIHGLILP